MAGNNQPDLFQADTQVERFDETAAPVYCKGDPDRIRARLHRILSEARAANVLPWDPARARLYRRIVPQMSVWLPEDEGAQLPSAARTCCKRGHRRGIA